MKKLLLSLVLFLFSSSLFAQIDVTGGMGITYVNNASLTDYLNIFFPSDSELNTFSSTVEFFIETDYSLNKNYQIGLEYVYQLFSYNTSYGGGVAYALSYSHHKPSFLAYYVISGKGYKFKFGGGLGLRFISLSEKILTTADYSATGFGVLLKAQGHTSLGGNVYLNLGVDLKYDFPGEPQMGDRYIVDNTIDENINLNSLSAGVKIGISYFFD